MIKHVGKHKNRKIVVVFRKVPNEPDNALIAYTEALPSLLHDELMKCIEGQIAQQSTELGDVLFRTLMADGTTILNSLHMNKLLTKVSTKDVVMTPTSSTKISLDQINDLVDKINSKEPMGRDLGEPEIVETREQVLSDADLAKERKQQALKMRAEAKRLLNEADRLEKEASSFATEKNERKATKTKKKQAAEG
jgi:hypothetical protein